MSRLTERIENFNKAFNLYKRAIEAFDKENELTHMALIQSFEVCFELAWKVVKDYLNQEGIEVYLPKQVIKEAFNNEVIKTGQIWIEMLETRNSTSHEYNMEKVNEYLIKICTSYYKELTRFSKQIEEFNG